VGTDGLVVAVDLQEIRQAFPSNVIVLRGDVFEIASSESFRTESAAAVRPVLSEHAPYDIVLSDMAPSTSGSKISDQARSFDLFMKALDVAASFGKSGSHFVGKIFMSSDFATAKAEVASKYRTVRVIRPEGTRSGSSEVFVVGMVKT